MSVLIHSARAVDAAGDTPDAWVLFDGDTITATGSGPDRPDADEVVDVGGATITPGFLDLHTHGGGGHSFDEGADEMAAALRTHRAHGTTRTLISLVANPIPTLEASLRTIRDLTATDPLVLGAHLEGPFLAPGRRGAHHPHYLANPEPGFVDELLAAGGDTIRMITLAPELQHGMSAIRTLSDAGVVVAVGHTDADFDQAARAFDAGARVLTHAFNAMKGIHHREPGPIMAAVADPRVTIELILDGVHVAPIVAQMLMHAAPGRIALITDAMAAAGSVDGDYRLGELNVAVRDGLAHLRGTTTIAGSTLTQDAALRVALTRTDVTPSAAVAALTSTTATALGLGDRFGRLAAGYAADLVQLDEAWNVTRVWADGAVVHGR